MSSTHVLLSNPWREELNGTEEKRPTCKEQNNICFDDLLANARSELRENDTTKKQCLEHLQEWIQKNVDIQNCPSDETFLLRFLRFKKFSISMAEQVLLKYLNFRKRFKDFMYGLDYLQSSLILNGYIVVSPYRDMNGRRVIIYNLKKIDPHNMTAKDICFAHAVTYETLLADEENQILGVNHVADVESLSASFLAMWSINEFVTIIRWGEQSVPMRHKEINVLNFPTSLKYVYDFVRSNIKSQKLKDRINIHNSLSDLHTKVNKQCLPQEFGGIMPLKEMTELWKKELAAKRELLLSYDSINLLSDKGIICRRNTPAYDDTGVGSLPGSFRKLEVD